MKFSHKFGYIALGGLLMLIGMIASSVFMPNLFAEKDKFGEIECTALTVVDADGIPLAILDRGGWGGGSLTIFEKLERDINDPSSLARKTGDIAVSLGVNGAGPYISVWGDKTWEDKQSAVKVSISGGRPVPGVGAIVIHGVHGSTKIYGRDLKLCDSDGEIGVNLYTSTTYGGTISVNGKVVNREKRDVIRRIHPSVHVNQFGRGNIEVRDGHNYRLVTSSGDAYGKDD